jgi:hypothetical protein
MTEPDRTGKKSMTDLQAAITLLRQSLLRSDRRYLDSDEELQALLLVLAAAEKVPGLEAEAKRLQTQHRCPHCGGTGNVPSRPNPNVLGAGMVPDICGKCLGTGWTNGGSR